MPEPTSANSPTPRRIKGTAFFALVFGILTIAAGGAVIFGQFGAREGAGAVVPFVLWFNFAAGFAYVTAAYGIWSGKAWAFAFSLSIAAATLAVAIAFAAGAMSGMEYEPRTVAALALRISAWIGIAFLIRGPAR